MMQDSIAQTIDLKYSYPKSRRNDIDSLSLDIPRGSIYGFLGPNGSGKTTTLRLLLGLLRGGEGQVKLFGKNISSERINTLSKIGALIENPSLYEHLSARENLKISANYRGQVSTQKIDELLELVKLTHAEKKKVKAYSLGMKQRLGLAKALLSNPDLLILDEPTNGLDPKGIIEMRSLIKELNEKQGTTILISSHLLSEIEKTCTHVGIIREGKLLYQDTVKALKASQSDNIIIQIESNNTPLTKTTVETMGLAAQQIDDETISVHVSDKSSISLIIDTLRRADIQLYQVRIMDNLEDLFLSLTES